MAMLLVHAVLLVHEVRLEQPDKTSTRIAFLPNGWQRSLSVLIDPW
jgi:hypothetical protein